MLMGSDCIIEVGNFVQNPPLVPPIDEEFTGPICANEFAIAYILELFPWLTEEDITEIEFLLYNVDERNILASYTAGDEERTENMKGYIELKSSDQFYNVDRFIDVWNLMDQDPNALLSDCFTQNGDYDEDFWSDLANFIPNQTVLDKIESMGNGWQLQSFLTPTMAPSLNLDYFSVTINQLPVNPQTGVLYTADGLLDFIRKNISLFVEQSNSEFIPFGYPGVMTEYNRWQSSNPFNTVMSIDIKIATIPGTNISIGDDGSVICSQFENCCWLFSTLKAPMFPIDEDGFHPVSGTRQFGYEVNPGGGYTFFTKGADRHFSQGNPFDYSHGIIAYLLEKGAFSGADALWSSFQLKIQQYVNNNYGEAVINAPIKERPKALAALKNLLKGSYPINQLPCGN